MNFYFKLNDIVDHVPFKKEGQYAGYSIILIGGSGYTAEMFNYYKPPSNFYNSFYRETQFPHINFQSSLAKKTLTFAYDRPTDLLNTNLYLNKNNKHVYIASKKDLNIKNYALFMHNLFKKHNIQPPFVFVCFSEGAYDFMCFAKHYKKCIKNCFFIDTPYLENNIFLFEKLRNNLNWYKDILQNKFSWDRKQINNKNYANIDAYNFEIKTTNIILKLKVKNIPTTVPIYTLWSPYYDTGSRINNIKVRIQKKQSKMFPKNVKSFWWSAPHQMERTVPKTLSSFILKNIYEK